LLLELYFDGAVISDYKNDDVIAMEPADIFDSDLSDDTCTTFIKSRAVETENQRRFPNYFYCIDSFQHPLTHYFYRQIQLESYNHIRLKDDLIDYNCHSNKVLNVIFIIDLHFTLDLPAIDQSRNSILIFCDNVFRYLNN
jgi:hypothetical protein